LPFSPAHSGSDDDETDEPTLDLGTLGTASSGGDPMGFFESRARAEDYLDRLDLSLFENDNGALVACDKKTGEPSGATIPLQAIVAYMMVYDEAWHVVEGRNKRGRRS
jgi:hypothetical protein